MATRLLNSGDLKDYLAIGEDGELVWQRAEAFRSSILTSEQLGEKYADYLAIPRFSADGSHVDWFVPFSARGKDGEYDIVSWNAASEEERQKAYCDLERLNEKFLNYGYNLEARALSANDKLFAHFLTGNKKADVVNPAIHFPDASCIYLVDGHPVITFWGFINRGQKLAGSPFDTLRSVQRRPAAQSAAAAPAAAAAAATTSHKWCYILLPLLLLLLPLLLYLLWWYLYARDTPVFSSYPDLLNMSLEPVKEEQAVEDPLKLKEKDPLYVTDRDYHNGVITTTDGTVTENTTLVPAADGTVTDGAAADGVLPEETASSEDATPDAAAPEALDDNAEAQEDNTENKDGENETPDNSQPENANADENKADDANKENPDEKAAVDDEAKNSQDNSDEDKNKADDQNQNSPTPPELAGDEGPALSNSDLNSGNIQKLDGNWKVNTPIVDKITNRPIQLEYNFKDGKGTATISQKNGVKCTADVDGALAKGTFSINSRSAAKCTDGSTYAMPKVVCKPGSDGNSDCTSSYSGKEKGTVKSEFPMVIHR